MVKLIHMSEADFQSYLEQAIPGYAEENVKVGNWPADTALEQSRQQYQKLLPEGVATPDQHLYSILDGETGEKVGTIWFARTSWDGIPMAFIYDFLIHPQFRRRGYASQALLAIEEEVKAVGLNRIGLHVFGHNHVAIGLYQKSGYQVTNINMAKELQ